MTATTNTNTLTGLAWMRSRLQDWKPNKIDPNLHRDLKHGWMVNVRETPEDIATAPILFELEGIAHGRWDYWLRTAIAGKLLDEPIPQIEWDTGSSRYAEGEGSGARNHLEKCLDLIPKHGGWLGWSSWQFFEYFLDWLLYAFGHPGQPRLPQEPSGCEGASMRLYQYFNLAWLIAYPWDYFGAILALNSYGKSLGFYPTPMSVVTMMSQMLMLGEDCRDKKTLDCCVGTGRMLLAASNYSLRLYGQDINPVVIKATLVNGYMYAPWLVKPFPFLDEVLVKGHLEIPPKEAIAQGDALTELTCLPTIIPNPRTESNNSEEIDSGLEKWAEAFPDLFGSAASEPTQEAIATHTPPVTPNKTVSAVLSDSMTEQAIASQPANVAEYLADTVHDTENQWQFEPIKKRKRKGVDLPAQSELKPVKASSKTGKMIALMARSQGVTMQELLEQINPNEASVRVYFGYDLKKKGYGCREDTDKGTFHLVLPDGVTEPLLS